MLVQRASSDLAAVLIVAGGSDGLLGKSYG